MGAKERWMAQALDELRSRVGLLVPSMEALRRALNGLPGHEVLTDVEENVVLRCLERVWHIMRFLSLLSRYFCDKMFFGGGAILNYVYMVGVHEPPRLTFDLDSTWGRKVYVKRTLLREVVLFNRWLDDQGLTLDVPVSDRKVAKIFIVEYDVEKDFFPGLLYLRIPVLTRHDGRPLYRFLGLEDYWMITRLRKVFEDSIGVRNPRINYARLEVSLDPAGMPREETVLRDLFKHKAVITTPGYQLATKITQSLGKDFGEDIGYTLHDVLKALLDLRLLSHVDPSSVRSHIGDVATVNRNVERSTALLLKKGRKLWERNYHYALIRKIYRLEELVSKVRQNIEKLLL